SLFVQKSPLLRGSKYEPRGTGGPGTFVEAVQSRQEGCLPGLQVTLSGRALQPGWGPALEGGFLSDFSSFSICLAGFLVCQEASEDGEYQTWVVLAEVIKAFGSPENAQRMEEARDNACNDMGKMLQFLLPVATQIQQDVIKAYGFSNDGEGVLKFARLIKSYESQDPEIANMSGKLKAMFLPPMTLPPHGAGTGGVAAS
uniref:Protein C10 n=2 Tax=Emydidae TaxID=8476 RepID=A0A674INW5_9SAUR